jgi:hypothetical protein
MGVRGGRTRCPRADRRAAHISDHKHLVRQRPAAFNLRERVPVLCYDPRDPRGFAFWIRPKEWLGWNGLFVATSDAPIDPKVLEQFFRRVEFAAEFPMARGGNPFRTVRVYRCIEQVQPVPFTMEKRPG